MELRHLRYFVAVAEERNFSRAARRERVAQPALSKQVRSLEGELGAALFLRLPRTVELTSAGAMLLPRARKLLLLARRTEAAVRGQATHSASRLRIATTAAAGIPALDAALTELRTTRPAMRLELVDLPSGLQVAALQAGKVDLCLGLDLPSPRRFSSLLMLRDRLMLVVPETHEFARRPEIPATELRAATFVCLRPELGRTLRRAFASYCRAHGIPLRIRDYFETVSTGLRLVANGHGLAPAPSALCGARHDGTVFRELAPPGPRLDWHLIWNRDRAGPLVEFFVELARSHLKAPALRPPL